jgi:hypothetical protein
MVGDRQYQEGDLRQIEMKAWTRYVDGRLDQVVRNRMNMFEELGLPIPHLARTNPPPIERPTRHCHTPYAYSTRWITHPPEDSALAPEPENEYATSYLTTPNADRDHIRREKHTESKYAALRWNERQFHHTVRKADATIKKIDEKNLRDIRAQRKGHAASLEERHKREHYYFFE